GGCHEFLVREGSSPGISFLQAGAFRGQNLDDVNPAVDKGAYDTTHVIRSANAILHIGELWEFLEEPRARLLDNLKSAGHNIWKSSHTRTVLISNTYPAVPRSHSSDAGLKRHTGLILIDMNVSINQTGQQPPTLQIEDRCVLRNFGSGGRDTFDPAIAHNYGSVANWLF
ncbi:MAG TPA: hypothetical protein VJ306_11445, partial [Pyrinomonadaceae bacterium]|nr:hypothetical protein [Pyrinomonadaceae bacterium]